MLEKLFGSKTRVALLKIFLEKPERLFFVRELSRETGLMLNSVRRELGNLLKMKLIVERQGKGVNKSESKKFFQFNNKNLLRKDLENILLKEKLHLEEKLADSLKKIGNLDFLTLSGSFVNDPKALTDVFIIGKINKDRLERIVKKYEKELKQELRYTVMSLEEFNLRYDLGDSFTVNSVSNEKNIILVDEFNIKNRFYEKT